MSNEVDVEVVVTAVKQSVKYGDTSEATIRELAEEAVRQHKKAKPAIKAVRVRLHSIMAPYLGDPDYAAEAVRLDAAFAANDAAAIAAVCLDCLNAHLSTRERLPILTDFYERIFTITGKPQTIMDIACGLNPLALRSMGLLPDNGTRKTDDGLRFYAYDIHEPRIAFINHYFRLEGLPELARVQDVASALPQETVDVALFLKEMPRFERNYGGRGRPLLDALNANYLVISYPAVSTHGGRNLTNRYREFMFQLIAGHDWPVTELLFDGELVFIVEKNAGNR
jgi:16S rRNA (guanine(1405)-N(7))-methyltransferase